MTDKQLYRLCKKYGARALSARRKFLGLLPRVYERELWRRRGFASIYEFAARLGGVSHEQVDGAVRLERRLRAYPELQRALVNGEVSVTKLERVASVAGKVESVQLLNLTKELSYAALDVKVKEIRSENCSSKPQAVLCAQTFQFDPDVEQELKKLQEQGHDLSGILREFLKKRTEGIDAQKEALEQEAQAEIPVEKEKLERKERECEQSHRKLSAGVRGMNGRAKRSRYIKANIKKLLIREYGYRCVAPACRRRAEQLHHLQEFARGGLNSPKNLRPLCRGHHQLEHKWRHLQEIPSH